MDMVPSSAPQSAMTDANMLPRIIHTQLAIDNVHAISRNTRVCVCVCVRVRVCVWRERDRERVGEGETNTSIQPRGKAHTCRNVHRYIITPDKVRHI
jgi:hypothetical protein